MTLSLTVPARFCGPPRSGNGGWTAGALAALVPGRTGGAGTVEVTLRRPPPLDTEIPVTVNPDGLACEVAEARAVDRELWLVAAETPDRAAAAEASYAGLRNHPFPTCFSCGTGRAPGDGLRIFPGHVADSPAGGRRVAATWVPHASVAGPAGGTQVSEPVTWAALDCVGAWSDDLEERPVVLGRMTARVDSPPVVGARYVLVGERRAVQGRKTLTASALYDEGGRVLARAEHVWISVDPAAFG